MLSSMFSGVSGLRSHQIKMDVIGNNIANVNTTAFKSSSVTFEEVYSQSVKAARPPSMDGSGGSNPQQIGLGVTIGDIAIVHKKGSIQRTDNPNDLAIDGEGFFITSDGTMQKYTRAGNFNIDRDGNLVTASGAKIQGWNIDSDGDVDTSRPVEAVNFADLSMPAQATSSFEFTGNLDSRTLEYDSVNDENFLLYNITIYDSLGEDHTVTFKFMKTANDNEYDYELLENDDSMDITAGATGGTITFEVDGKLSSTTAPVTPEVTIQFSNGADDITIADGDMVFNENNFTQYANATKIDASQNGYTSGILENLSIDREGQAIGRFTNGRQMHVSTIAIASFINVSGLEKAGNNQFTSTWNSGEPNIGKAGTGERGLISTGSLEMSNVDLAKEFTEMIVAQRGFQANSRIITTADELLQELVNLKR